MDIYTAEVRRQRDNGLKEIDTLKDKLAKCEEDSEAYLDSAQHNMEVALLWKKAHEKLTKEVKRLQAEDRCLRSTLQSYRDEHEKYRQIDIHNHKTFTVIHELTAELNETKLSANSEGWVEGWEAACRYHELPEEAVREGMTIHEDYDELKRENTRLVAEVAQLKEY